jgi:DNA modification methylase
MTPGRALIIRGDAAHLPLPDESVDLIVTSPPYFGLRSYTDGGKHYTGQIGSEATPQEWLNAMIECTQEWVRVLKPTGSIFVNLGDKFAGSGGNGNSGLLTPKYKGNTDAAPPSGGNKYGGREKSLLGLPWRYALACTDNLGLILRRDIIWHKLNGLPESVTDRARTSHEYLFHMVKSPRYYSAIDEIREPYEEQWAANHPPGNLNGPRLLITPGRERDSGFVNGRPAPNPLGKLPGSVWKIQDDDQHQIWDIPSQPLTVPQCRLVWDGTTIRWFTTWTEGWAYMRQLARDRWAWEQHRGRPSLRPEVDHFAAFPMELPRRVILGWSPPGICVACGQGRTPVTAAEYERGQDTNNPYKTTRNRDNGFDAATAPYGHARKLAAITGYACACIPHTNHPGTGQSSKHGPGGQWNVLDDGTYPNTAMGLGHAGLSARPKTGPWREYHLNQWTPPPTHPALILDPFSGTGTTTLIASILGRNAIGVDMSQDYSRLARWRTTDRPQTARAMGVKKPPPPPPDNQPALF